MKKRLAIIIGIVIVVIVGIAVAGFMIIKANSKQEVQVSDPSDVITDFYFPWLEAVQATTTDPYTEGFDQNPILSKELRERLAELKPQVEGDLDPVLCQTVIPEKLALRNVFTTEAQVQYLITARKSESTNQAIVTLNKLNDGWYIDKINCSPGEFPPDREFTFEREGALLKDSIIEPYNPEFWHLVFTENNQPGHVVPLIFSAESMCSKQKEEASVCNPSAIFVEAMDVFVQGNMTERGVEVKKIEIAK